MLMPFDQVRFWCLDYRGTKAGIALGAAPWTEWTIVQ